MSALRNARFRHEPAPRPFRIGGVLLVCLGFAASAETLDDAWRTALANDFELRAAGARTAGAEAALEAARAERRPTLTATTAASRWRDTPAFDFAPFGLPVELELFGGETSTLSEARASLPIYTAGMIAANVAAQTAAVVEHERATEALTEELKLAVAEAYIGVLRAERALAVAKSNTASLAAHVRDVEDMQREGQVPRNDYLAAVVSLADAEQRQLQAQNALAIAHAMYNRQLGRPLATAVALEPLQPEPPAPADEPLDGLIAAALAGRAELAQLAAAAAALDSRADATRAARRPQLALHGGYTFLENDVLNREDFWSVAVAVRWQLFDGGRTRHAAAALVQQSAAAENEREHFESLIELEVRRAWLDLGATRARLTVAGSAVTQAEENLRVVRDRYRNGEGTNTEVLDAEALRAASLSNLDNARYDAVLAELRLARAVGRL